MCVFYSPLSLQNASNAEIAHLQTMMRTYTLASIDGSGPSSIADFSDSEEFDDESD